VQSVCAAMCTSVAYNCTGVLVHCIDTSEKVNLGKQANLKHLRGCHVAVHQEKAQLPAVPIKGCAFCCTPAQTNTTSSVATIGQIPLGKPTGLATSGSGARVLFELKTSRLCNCTTVLIQQLFSGLATA
jgi:hypothetical protein